MGAGASVPDMVTFKREPDQRQRFYVVAYEGGQEIGFVHALYLHQDQTLVILESELSPSHRGRGYGTQLYLAAIEKGKVESRGAPFKCVPDSAYRGKTNQSALRVWGALKRRFPSEGAGVRIDSSFIPTFPEKGVEA
jgi:predicted GNAT family acetyltransferase